MRPMDSQSGIPPAALRHHKDHSRAPGMLFGVMFGIPSIIQAPVEEGNRRILSFGEVMCEIRNLITNIEKMIIFFVCKNPSKKEINLKAACEL